MLNKSVSSNVVACTIQTGDEIPKTVIEINVIKLRYLRPTFVCLFLCLVATSWKDY